MKTPTIGGDCGDGGAARSYRVLEPVTASQGGFTGDTAELDVTLTRGGLFDDPAPVGNEAGGSMTIQFTSCNQAAVSHDLPGRSGAFEVQRLANDNTATCDSLANQLSVPFESP
jgi:hypothetical protein